MDPKGMGVVGLLASIELAPKPVAWSPLSCAHTVAPGVGPERAIVLRRAEAPLSGHVQLEAPPPARVLTFRATEDGYEVQAIGDAPLAVTIGFTWKDGTRWAVQIAGGVPPDRFRTRGDAAAWLWRAYQDSTTK